MKYLPRFLLLVLVLLSACSTTTPTAAPTTAFTKAPGNTPTILAPGTPGYPAAVTPGVIPSPLGYPAPGTSTDTTPKVKPTIDPKLGQVSGTLIMKGSPWAQADLYLAPIIPNAKGTEVAAQLVREKDPVTGTDSQGKFSFVNVPPGRYALMFYDHPQAFLLLDPKTRLAVTATVEVGKALDLGTLSYDQMPQ